MITDLVFLRLNGKRGFKPYTCNGRFDPRRHIPDPTVGLGALANLDHKWPHIALCACSGLPSGCFQPLLDNLPGVLVLPKPVSFYDSKIQRKLERLVKKRQRVWKWHIRGAVEIH